ncbi:MAG TPA: polysaccharide biosynthesis/export family protein [Verrucomicrobiae bacterium]|nr:polysaccharide biosynthesis/export family protein [Verrucomicrobiae bacterium]
MKFFFHQTRRPGGRGILPALMLAASLLASAMLIRAADGPAPAKGQGNAVAPGSAAAAVLTNSLDAIPTNSMETLDSKYKLAAGDRIRFQILEDQDDPKSILVSDSGDVDVPYLGRFPAAGKTCKQLAQQLKAELEKKYYYRATVIVSVESMVSRGVIYLVGAVRNPGPLELPRDDVLTVSKAILRAGGFTDFADEKHVRITRKGEGAQEAFTEDVSQVLDKGRTEKDQTVESGDLIYIPERVFRF